MWFISLITIPTATPTKPNMCRCSVTAGGNICRTTQATAISENLRRKWMAKKKYSVMIPPGWILWSGCWKDIFFPLSIFSSWLSFRSFLFSLALAIKYWRAYLQCWAFFIWFCFWYSPFSFGDTEKVQDKINIKRPLKGAMRKWSVPFFVWHFPGSF